LDVRVFFGDLLGNLPEETIGELHDVRLVDRGHLAAAVGEREIESEVDDSGAGRHRDGLDTEPGVRSNRFSDSCANPLNHDAGIGVPYCSMTPSPAFWTSHWNSTRVASSTRRVASLTSGPTPSPGIRVTR